MSMTRSPQCSLRPGPWPAPARPLARRSLLAALLVAAPALVGSGCVAGSQLVPQRAELLISGSARILLKDARGGTLTFDVYNHTGGQMLIQRDAFFLSTPRLAGEQTLNLRFSDPIVDTLAKARLSGAPGAHLEAALGLERGGEAWNALTTTTAPALPAPQPALAEGEVRVTYFGHACVLLESAQSTVLMDPALSWERYAPDAPLSMRDLPGRLDYLVISHGHHDHFSPEMLLQLRWRAGRVLDKPGRAPRLPESPSAAQESTMSQAIADLRHEHDAILEALQILERMTAQADAADLAAFVDFLREFVDRCHHGKEEGLLFPAMTRAGLAEHGGFIDELHAEHVQGRALVQTMAQACTPTLRSADFAAAATAYAGHLRAHIAKENDVLFPMAERLLDDPILAALAQGFAEHEERVMGAGRHAQLHALLHQLKAKYLG